MIFNLYFHIYGHNFLWNKFLISRFEFRWRNCFDSSGTSVKIWGWIKERSRRKLQICTQLRNLFELIKWKAFSWIQNQLPNKEHFRGETSQASVTIVDFKFSKWQKVRLTFFKDLFYAFVVVEVTTWQEKDFYGNYLQELAIYYWY